MRNDDVWNDLPPRDETYADHPRQVARDSFTREDAELYAWDVAKQSLTSLPPRDPREDPWHPDNSPDRSTA